MLSLRIASRTPASPRSAGVRQRAAQIPARTARSARKAAGRAAPMAARWWFIASALMCTAAVAEDIDLFAGVGGGAAGNPTLIVVLDNSASSGAPLLGSTKLALAWQGM